MRGLRSSENFYFGEAMRSLFTQVEMLPEHSPTWGKTYRDILTVEEVIVHPLFLCAQ